MSRVSTFAGLFFAFVLTVQVHAVNIPPPWIPDPRPVIDPVPTTCLTSTVNIACGNNVCQNAWATAFTSSNAYIQSFCSSFTSPGRRNTLIFDQNGPATACMKGLGNAVIQSSISSVCSCYAGPGVPTQAFITICPTCSPVQAQTVTTTIPTTIVKTVDGNVKTVTTIITLVVDPPPPIRITTITTATTTTTQVITTTRPDLISAPCTTTLVTAIYDYFTFLTTTTTYPSGSYPCITTILNSPTVSTVTFFTPYCNQISERVVTVTSTVTAGLPFLPPSGSTCEPNATMTVTSTVTAGLPFLPPSSSTCVPNATMTVTSTVTAGLPFLPPSGSISTATTTVTLVIDPLPIEHTVTETVSQTGKGDCGGVTSSSQSATFSPIIIDDGGLTFLGTSVVPSSTVTTSSRRVRVRGEEKV
ncbi:hypothetical protein NHQ30_004094 [Ciborinia camelliae]|nr:hypothetical protein NHQ30_004094 [Ciborinia camelliae]